jgi:ADP-heptose:LPS heptosyltransferase
VERSLSGDPLADIGKIAVLRANAIGDFVVTLPALFALRAAYPQAQIVLLGTPMHAELLAGRPSPIDRVEIVPQMPGVRNGEEDPDAVEAFTARMRDERFDLAVQLHGGGKNSNPLVRRLGARTTVGLRAPDAEPLDRWIPYVNHQHEILRILEVVALVGAQPQTITPWLAVTEQDRVLAKAALNGRRDPIAVLHPGAMDARRRWPVESFAHVGDELARAGAQVVITGSAQERDLAAEVARLMRREAGVLAGESGLAGLIGLLERATVVVSNDTGPRHLAEAVGTPTVAIYWCGNMINVGPLMRRRHRAHVSWRLNCPECGANTMLDACCHPASFVADVQVDDVVDQALDLLGRR